MLIKTTVKLAGSLFFASIVATIISVMIILMLGGIGSKSSSASASSKVSGVSSSSAAVSKSTTQSSANAGSSQSETGTVSNSSSSKTSKQTKTSSTDSLYSTGGLISYAFGKFLLGVLSILITLAILYSTAWHEGTRDPNRIKYGHMQEFKLKGFVAGLLAIIPGFLITTVFFISQAVAAKNAFGILTSIIYRVMNIQYIVFSDAFLYVPAVCYLLLLITPIISELGYLAGRKNLSLMSRLVYNQKKQTKTGKKSATANKH